jgi:hypothetical protein
MKANEGWALINGAIALANTINVLRGVVGAMEGLLLVSMNALCAIVCLYEPKRSPKP